MIYAIVLLAFGLACLGGLVGYMHHRLDTLQRRQQISESIQTLHGKAMALMADAVKNNSHATATIARELAAEAKLTAYYVNPGGGDPN